MDMASVDDGWAVGGGLILHWDGIAWRPMDSPADSYLESVAVVSSADAWAVGRKIVHWNGVTWSLIASPTTEWLSDVDMVSAVDGWAVGARYTDPMRAPALGWRGMDRSRVPHRSGPQRRGDGVNRRRLGGRWRILLRRSCDHLALGWRGMVRGHGASLSIEV